MIFFICCIAASPNVQSSLRAGAEVCMIIKDCVRSLWIFLDDVEGFFLQTPLHIAAHHGRLEAVAGLLSAGSITSIRNAKGQTALDVAVERKQRDCLEMLKIYQG
jgi:hypothetical protein